MPTGIYEKTHCRHGHSLKNNTYTWESGIFCKSCVKISQQKHKIAYPWMQHYSSAKERCLNKRNKRHHHYGGRGIKFLMTKDDFKFLWSRDKACDMKIPSIDRIDNDGNYEIENCEFIEKSENSRKDTQKGEQCNFSKLTENNVREIRTLFKNGVNQVVLAKQFGIKQNTISRIVNNVTWKHIK